jgi:hypothetical protein
MEIKTELRKAITPKKHRRAVQARLEANTRASSVFRLGVIELDVGAMDGSRSLISIK